VQYHDPLVKDLDLSQVPAKRVELAEETVKATDCVVIVTNHDGYDWSWIVQNAQLIVDTWNALNSFNQDTIYRL